MDSDNEQGYKPPPDFHVEAKEPLIDPSLTDSKELWLIQWPNSKELPGLDGQELSLKLHHDGKLGSFEDSSGKVFDLVSFAAQESNATVFLSSESESKIVGKISRLVSLVHYPDPNESRKPISNNLRHFQKSSGISLTNSSRQFSTQSILLKNSQSTSGYSGSTHNSRRRSCLSEEGEPSSLLKKDVCVNLLGLQSVLLETQSEVIVQFLHKSPVTEWEFRNH
ncbi:hypothetical protein CIPAW_03G184600 [Carya illinoinensis]|nr:hypothetical protein CIPAW_03G184600 [Carya illinoinensis]KAG6722762.1 hypothetical protein I3842_03G176400 [Carya illinoinensis]